MPSFGVQIGVLLKNLIPDLENILVGFLKFKMLCSWTFVFGPSTLILLIWVCRRFHLKVMLYLSKPYCVAIFVVFFSVYLFFGSIPLLQLACQLFQFIYSDPSYKIVPTLSDKSLCICLSQIVFLFSFRVFFSSFFLLGGRGGGLWGRGWGGHLLVSIRMPTLFLVLWLKLVANIYLSHAMNL